MVSTSFGMSHAQQVEHLHLAHVLLQPGAATFQIVEDVDAGVVLVKSLVHPSSRVAACEGVIELLFQRVR